MEPHNRTGYQQSNQAADWTGQGYTPTHDPHEPEQLRTTAQLQSHSKPLKIVSSKHLTKRDKGRA
jgi:hypothetical protein